MTHDRLSTHDTSQKHPLRTSWVLAILLCVVCVVLRLSLLDRQSLWVDEVFSLAMATGHSLEHHPSLADPSLGDYVESSGPLPATAYAQLAEHDNPPVGPDRVVRAVRLSDTSPPLYYLLLYAWTKMTGTGDVTLKLFSALWALACLPFVFLLAKEIGGHPTVIPALWLFTFSPLSIYYSTEGRMYSMLWCLALCVAWLSLKLHQRGPHPSLFISWILVGTAGLLTHYFFSFAIAGCGMWLLVHPGRFDRRFLITGAFAIGLLIAPWYVMLPELQSGWRVTKGWLNVRTGDRWIAAFTIPLAWFSTNGAWNKAGEAMNDGANSVALGLFALLIVLLVFTLRGRVVSPRRLLLWFWLGSVCLGLAAFDWTNNTFALLEPRFALAGMPAGLLLMALGLGRIPLRWQVISLLLILAAWGPGIHAVVMSPHRNGQPIKQIGAILEQHTPGSTVVLVHSIPSGVVGLARYVPQPTMIYSWVSPLNQRQAPDDIAALAARHARIILVKVHAWGPFPDEDWLRQNATLVDERKIANATILVFVEARADPS